MASLWVQSTGAALLALAASLLLATAAAASQPPDCTIPPDAPLGNALPLLLDCAPDNAEPGLLLNVQPGCFHSQPGVQSQFILNLALGANPAGGFTSIRGCLNFGQQVTLGAMGPGLLSNRSSVLLNPDGTGVFIFRSTSSGPTPPTSSTGTVTESTISGTQSVSRGPRNSRWARHATGLQPCPLCRS